LHSGRRFGFGKRLLLPKKTRKTNDALFAVELRVKGFSVYIRSLSIAPERIPSGHLLDYSTNQKA